MARYETERKTYVGITAANVSGHQTGTTGFSPCDPLRRVYDQQSIGGKAVQAATKIGDNPFKSMPPKYGGSASSKRNFE